RGSACGTEDKVLPAWRTPSRTARRPPAARAPRAAAGRRTGFPARAPHRARLRRAAAPRPARRAARGRARAARRAPGSRAGHRNLVGELGAEVAGVERIEKLLVDRRVRGDAVVGRAHHRELALAG